MEFDEAKAVAFINNKLKAEGRNAYDEDEVLNIIDMIWDFYQENGLLSLDADPEDDPDDIEAELVDYVHRMLRKDKNASVAADDVAIMVAAELEYEDSVL